MNPSDNEMMSIREVCRFFGGSRPVDPSTIYRMINRGDVPAPIKYSPQLHRWSRSDCEKARQALIDRAHGKQAKQPDPVDTPQEDA